MTLKEAREFANSLRITKNQGVKLLTYSADAIVILDDRVAELETQRNELLESCKALMDAIGVDDWGLAVDKACVAIQKTKEEKS